MVCKLILRLSIESPHLSSIVSTDEIVLLESRTSLTILLRVRMEFQLHFSKTVLQN